MRLVVEVLIIALMLINFLAGMFNAWLALSAAHHWQSANIAYLCFAGVVVAGIALWRWTKDESK